MTSDSLLSRLDARDRDLFARWSLVGRPTSLKARARWVAITHLGGFGVSVAACVLPLLLASGDFRRAAGAALIGLILSHVIVQIVKRCVGRRRPSSRFRCDTLVKEPPCFSFPSGHATAAMAVAFVYSAMLPAFASPLIAVALAIGFSRVRLGVHYPGDVLAGQTIAVLTDVAVLAWW